MIKSSAMAFLILLTAHPSAWSEQLTEDEKERIQLGIGLIKLGCGTGITNEDTKVHANTDATFTLKKLPGVTAGGEVTYSKKEVQALTGALNDVITHDAEVLSEKQLLCMKPYADRIFELLFPSTNHHSSEETSSPVTMTLLAKYTQPLDGYSFSAIPILPQALVAGPLLPGGGRTRIAFQVANPDQVVQIDKVSVVVDTMPISDESLAYTVDPLKQPGFGAARPRQFLLRVHKSGRSSIFYINSQNKSFPVAADNILPKNDFPILELDAHAGLQETLDVTIVPDDPGLYKLIFRAIAVSGGREYELETVPLYVIRH